MNIRIIGVISLYILLMQLASCQNKDARHVTEILVVTPVGMNFVSSEENSDLIITGKKYWVHYKASYKNDSLVQFKRCLPEGPIDYSIEELISDTAIYESIGVPLKQNWHVYQNELYSGTRKLDVSIIRLDGTHFMEESGRRVFVTKEK